MEQYPFYIEVTWCYWEDNKSHQKQEAVILMAETFTQAVSKIEENYGDELYSIEKVECISDCTTLTMPLSEGRKMVKLLEQYDRGEIPVEDKVELVTTTEVILADYANRKQKKEVRWNPREDANPPMVPQGTVIIVDYEA